MFGSIMPEPFAVPPTLNEPRPVCTDTAPVTASKGTRAFNRVGLPERRGISTSSLVPKLPWPAIGAVWVYSLIWMVVLDIAKLIYYRAAANSDAHVSSLTARLTG